MKTVAIIGASGYSGEELVRLVLSHPGVELVAVTSRQNAGQTIAQVFPRFAQHRRARALRFTDSNAELVAKQAQIVFLALPHGVAAQYAAPLLQLGCQVIDLSADFRLKDPAVYKEYYGHDHPAPELLAQAVYGLPEVYRAYIRQATLVASPGCYPTSILLPILPLLRAGLIKPTGIIADSLSGVSGAGRKVEADYLFVECNESVRPYGVPKHRHLAEIEQELTLGLRGQGSGGRGQPGSAGLLAGEFKGSSENSPAGTPALPGSVVIQFTPHLIPVNRGILTTLYLAPAEHFEDSRGMDELGEKLAACYQTAYGNEPFVRLLDSKSLPDTKNVIGTNCIEIGWRLDPRTGRLIVMSAEDNLLKGASGQAVQSMNLMCGLLETAGLL